MIDGIHFFEQRHFNANRRTYFVAVDPTPSAPWAGRMVTVPATTMPDLPQPAYWLSGENVGVLFDHRNIATIHRAEASAPQKEIE